MTHSRRSILKAGLGGAGILATGQILFGADAVPAKEKKEIPIGLQLYSVREDCKKDMAAVLKAVGKMGYQGVEFAGYFDHKAEDLRKMLDENKLKCCGTHTGIDTLLEDQFDKTVAFNKTLGNRFLIVPSLPHDRTASVEALQGTGKLFTELAAKAKPHKMRVGYHAHAGDLKKIGDKTAWEILFEAAGPEVVMQLDTSNCLDGGGDPVAILKKFPGRATTVHLKEHGGKKGAVIGEGEVNWKEVIQLCRTTAGTRWFIVEQESYAGAPLDSVKACLENLHKLLKA